MALADWIFNFEESATKTVATPATVEASKTESVAKVASVTVASSEKKENLPKFCRTTCPGLESIDLPGEGEVVGCVNPTTGAWRRLDWLSTCPAAPTPRKRTPPCPPLASWCKPDCDRLHLSDGVAWCCSEQDERHWSRRRIGAMNACPKEALI